MTQRNARGAYMNFEHDRAADWDWLSKWQPNVIRYMGGGNHTDPNSFDVNRVRRIHETCPDATILLRCWEVDDNNFKAHDAMVSNPHAEAERQVDWWAKVFDRAGAAGVPRKLLMAGLNNETGPEKDAALYTYSERALQVATPKAVRLGVFVFSVGRPSLPGEAQYTVVTFSQLDNAILANNGAVVLHEYLQPEGMYAVWTDEHGNERKDYTYLIGRNQRWPIKSPIIIGEWGIDGILYNRHPDPKYGNSGWRNFKAEWPPSRYADEYVECVRVASDNVIGTCPFLSDFSDHKWQSFDMLEAYEEFLARKDLCVRESAPSAKPETIHLPSIGTGHPAPSPKPTVGYVTATAGLRMRNVPPDGSTVAIVPFTEQVQIVSVGGGTAGTEEWLRVRYGEYEGWVHGAFISATKPAPLPSPTEPTPQEPVPMREGTIDPLVLEAILQVESGGRGFGNNGKLLIRFEAHVFRDKASDKARVDQFFRFNQAKPWTEQQRRITVDHPWKEIHTGAQTDEYDAFAEAQMLNTDAAHLSISMGAPQVMGFNHARLGYANARDMFASFSRSVNQQIIGMINYMLSDPELFAAVNVRDWEAIAYGYNGGGNVAEAAAKYRAAYRNLGGT